MPQGPLPSIRSVRERMVTPVASPIETVGVVLLGIYVFIMFSRILDVTFNNLKLPIIIFALFNFALLLSGNVFRLLQSRAGLALTVYTGWIFTTAPLAMWRTGSLDSLLNSAFSWSMALGVAAMLSVPGKLLTMQRVLAFASLTGAILGRFYSGDVGGRLALSQGSFSDPNEYAITLLMGLPYWIMVAKTSQKKIWKTLAYLCMIPILITFLYTGSRGGMVALLVVAVIGFIQMSFPQKLVFCGASGMLFLLGGVLLPPYIQQRYFTFFKADTNAALDAKFQEQLEGGDVGSSEMRWQLLMGGIRLTLQHPVFGVGPGNFPAAYYADTKSKGQNGGWNANHNSYTEVSSEMGIPGLGLFLAMLFYSFRIPVECLESSPPPNISPPRS